MAQTKIVASTLLNIFFVHVILAATNADADGAQTGLSFELIRPDFSANLTYGERLNRLLKNSDARIQWLKSAASSWAKEVNTTAIRPPVHQSEDSFMVSLRLGTGASQQNYLLELDTGSSLTWTQCVPCDPCFRQEGRPFDPRGSPTYRRVPCNDPLCIAPRYRCVDNSCEYNIHYVDATTTNGKLSRETFGFQTDRGRGVYQSIAGLAFGCSHRTQMNYANGKIAGILGMNGSPESFASQLGDTASGRFSYCLVALGFEGHAGYLRFGSDIVMRGAVQRTPMVIRRHYYLTLLDISLANKRMNLDRRVFEWHPDTGKGGVFMDTAAGIGYMVTPAFNQIKHALLQYMKGYKFKSVRPDWGTCFPLQRGVQRILPSMTFHFQGADLEVGGIQMFYTEQSKGVFCWNLKGDDSMTVIGAPQQVNKRFTYDLRQSTLFFAPESCAQEVASNH